MASVHTACPPPLVLLQVLLGVEEEMTPWTIRQEEERRTGQPRKRSKIMKERRPGCSGEENE